MKDWDPPPEAWDQFLELLDPDRPKAGETYEDIRRRLITFFECRRCPLAEHLADIAINRVIRKHFEGQVIETLLGYTYGVAKLVYLEYLAEERKKMKLVEHLTRDGEPIEQEPVAETDLQLC